MNTNTTNAVPPAVAKLAQAWGWLKPPASVLEVAERSLGLQSSAKRDGLDEDDRALATGIPYYANFELLIQHSAMPEPAVSRWLEQHDAALMLVEGRMPVVVFASLNTLYAFRSEGRDERASNPVRAQLQGAGEPLVALGPRDAIAVRLKSVREGASGGGSAAANVLHSDDPDIARTDEGRAILRLLDHAIAMRATDIAIEPARDGSHVLRIRRFAHLMKPQNVEDKWSERVGLSAVRLIQVRSGANTQAVTLRVPTDGQLSYRKGETETFLRLSFIPVNHLGDGRGLQSVSIRLFDRAEHSLRLDQINLHPETRKALRAASHRSEGLIMVVGPTNSGKSTTIAAAIGENIDKWGDAVKRMTLEDPVERFYKGVTHFNVPPAQLVNDDESGGFITMLRAMLRHDPDVIWVGEVRDPRSADMAVSSAATGHLVFTTLHANNAITGWDLMAQRINPTLRFQLVEALAAVVSQRLVKELCPGCRVAHAPSADEIQEFEDYKVYRGLSAELPEKICRKGAGCKQCGGTGVLGQLPLDEVLVFSRAVKDLAHRQLAGDVRARAAMASVMSRTMQSTGLALLAQGRITLSDLLI